MIYIDEIHELRERIAKAEKKAQETPPQPKPQPSPEKPRPPSPPKAPSYGYIKKLYIGLNFLPAAASLKTLRNMNGYKNGLLKQKILM